MASIDGTLSWRAIPPRSVNEYQRKLGSKRAYYAMHWPRIRVRDILKLNLNETKSCSVMIDN